MLKKLPIPKAHPTRNILSSKDNNTGYTLNVIISKNGAKILETGVSSFRYSEALSSLYEIFTKLELPHNEFILLCADILKKGHKVDLENFPHFFYSLQLHAQLRDTKHKIVKEFTGLISSASATINGNADQRKAIISFTAHPVAWFMQESNNYQAFINKPADKIIEEVAQKFCQESKIGVNFKPKFILRKEKDLTRINCVQNGESYWDFILRLIDEEDWNYVFVHDKEKVEMHIYDNPESPAKLIPKGNKPFLKLEIIDSLENISQGTNDQLLMQKEYISNIEYSNNNIVTSTEVIDSDKRVHGKALKGKTSNPKNLGKNKKALQYKWYLTNEGAKKYATPSDVSKNSGVRAKKYEDKLAKNIFLATGYTNSVKVHLGSIVTAIYPMQTNSFKTIVNNKITNFRVQELEFAFGNITADNGSFSFFTTQIVMHPRESKFNVEHVYERNYIDGTTHAKVVADDKKIYLDKDFFIKISLPWQYNAKNNFIYARYMSPWASQKYGMFVTPRHDDEVIVTFEDGDPDLPLVIGSVYNPKKNYPVDFKAKKHVLTIYDQPSENKKNNYLTLDHITATYESAAAEHMRILSYGDHLTQSRLTMSMRTSQNMMCKSKTQMEFITEKNMLSTSKEEMEFKTEKNMLHESEKQMEFITKKNMLHDSKEHMDFITQDKMSFEAEKNIEFKTDKEFKIEALENISIKSEKELIAEMQNKISLNSQKEVVINVGSSQIKIENSGKITINCKKAIINSASTKVEIE